MLCCSRGHAERCCRHCTAGAAHAGRHELHLIGQADWTDAISCLVSLQNFLLLHTRSSRKSAASAILSLQSEASNLSVSATKQQRCVLRRISVLMTDVVGWDQGKPEGHEKLIDIVQRHVAGSRGWCCAHIAEQMLISPCCEGGAQAQLCRSCCLRKRQHLASETYGPWFTETIHGVRVRVRGTTQRLCILTKQSELPQHHACNRCCPQPCQLLDMSSSQDMCAFA